MVKNLVDNRPSEPGTPAAETFDVILYTRQGCHLCDVAHDLLRKQGVRPRLIDIDQDPKLVELYNECVPVVVIGGKVRFRGRVSEVLLKRLLRSRPPEPGQNPAAKETPSGWGTRRPNTEGGSPKSRADSGNSSSQGWKRWFTAAQKWLSSKRTNLPGEAEEVMAACPRRSSGSSESRESRCLGIMAKYWEPGQSKTRLGTTIGDERAAELSRRFLVHLLRNLRQQGDVRTLVFAPDDRAEAFRQLCNDPAIGQGLWGIEPQGIGDLGARMERFVRRARERGAEKVILIGSDMPTLSSERMEEAWRALDDYPVVLGPAEDGGYYLLGISGEPPPIFSGVPWGTAQVFAWTQHLLNQQGLAYYPLKVGFDVDRWEDLIRLQRELSDLAAPVGSAEALLQSEIDAIIGSPRGPARAP